MGYLIGGALVAAIVAWFIGSIVLRIVGVVLVIMGAVTMMTTGGLSVLIIIGLGVLCWLAGHILHAMRHRYWASALAYRTVQILTGGRLDPARGWGIPTA